MPPSPPHHQNLGHQSGVQLLPAPKVGQHHSTPDSFPPQHSGRPPVHSHPVLLGRPVPSLETMSILLTVSTACYLTRAKLPHVMFTCNVVFR